MYIYQNCLFVKKKSAVFCIFFSLSPFIHPYMCRNVGEKERGGMKRKRQEQRKNGRKLFASEVGRDFPPFLGFPLQNSCGDATRFEPLFGTRNHVEQRSGALCLFERGFALLVAHPTDGCAAVAIDGDVFESLFLYQRESVDNGEKFAYVVRSQHWTIVENLLSCAEIDAAIFHRTGFLAQAASTTTVENPTFSITSGEGMRMGRSLGECGERAASEVLAFRRAAFEVCPSEVAREAM